MWCDLRVNFVENVLLYFIRRKVVPSIECNEFAFRMMEKCKKENKKKKKKKKNKTKQMI